MSDEQKQEQIDKDAKAFEAVKDYEQTLAGWLRIAGKPMANGVVALLKTKLLAIEAAVLDEGSRDGDLHMMFHPGFGPRGYFKRDAELAARDGESHGHEALSAAITLLEGAANVADLRRLYDRMKDAEASVKSWAKWGRTYQDERDVARRRVTELEQQLRAIKRTHNKNHSRCAKCAWSNK